MYQIKSSWKGHDSKVIDTADTLEEANHLLGEYRMACGPDCLVVLKHVPEIAYDPNHPAFV